MKRYRVYSFINIAGLTIGIVVSLLLFIYIGYELSYDKYHENAENIFRVMVQRGTGTDIFTQSLLGPALKKEFPEVVNFTILDEVEEISLSYNEKCFKEDRLYFVDPNFLKIFNFPLVSASSGQALLEPFTVLITEKMPLKYFGSEHPIGKILRYNDTFNFKITGILKNTPENSHFIFDFLASYIVEMKTKEFGIRKVLGATAKSIIFMNVKEFLRWILVASIIAFPIAYYTMNKWLYNFAYKSEMSWWIFILSGLITFILAIFAVSFQTLKAAHANPVNSLRYE